MFELYMKTFVLKPWHFKTYKSIFIIGSFVSPFFETENFQGKSKISKVVNFKRRYSKIKRHKDLKYSPVD